MAEAAKPTARSSLRRRTKILAGAAAVVLLSVVIAAKAGLLGYGWAALGASLFPSDHALLAYVPGDVGGVAILDPHQIDERSLAGGQGTLRSGLAGRVEAVKKVTGIDLAFDVDKLLLTPTLVVARGRFDGARLAERLAENNYVKAERGGVAYLVRQGEDAIAVIEDEVLLYGDEPALQASIDARENGTSLKANERAVERMDEIGWDHALLLTIRLHDDKPSLRSMLGGASGPRAVTIGVKTADGAVVKAAVEAASPAAAEDLRKQLEEHRARLESIEPHVGAALAPHVLEAAKTGVFALDPGSSTLRIQAHLSPALLDALAGSVGKTDQGVAARYRTFRLWQLLAP